DLRRHPETGARPLRARIHRHDPRAASRAHQRCRQGTRHPAHESLSKNAVASRHPAKGNIVTAPRTIAVYPGNFLLTGVHMRVLAVMLALALTSPVSPLVATSVAQAEAASVAGTAASPTGETLVNATVQLRDL